MKFSRRGILVGAAATGVGALAVSSIWNTSDAAAEPQPLRIPPLLDARKHGNSVALDVRAGQTEFYSGRASNTLGYNGSYLGPTLRLYRGDDVELAVTNQLREDTTVHWHGLLIPAELDGGPHQRIPPNATWRPVLPVRQAGATLFYHSHAHGQTGAQVYSGLAGLLLIADDQEESLGLPTEYGVDDLPLVLQDRQFENGYMVAPGGMMSRMAGWRGDTIVVNGTPNAVTRVPGQRVRLRLLNGSNARIFNLSFSDRRSFHWIASEGGLLNAPVSLKSISLAPGERAEILVDFSDRKVVALQTAPDTNLPMMMGPLSRIREFGDDLFGSNGERILQFEPFLGEEPSTPLPERLASRPPLNTSRIERRRRFVLGMGGMGGGMMGGMGSTGGMTINGRAFAMDRVDERIELGSTEIWEVSSDMMSHPFHIHGVQFEVMSRNGGKPLERDAGSRDTVVVREPVELLVRFEQPAVEAPFMYHCHILEHEDDGMMGQFATV
uniref:multicopper oxidase family protein n=1 Tax=Pararhizobium sp. IMCC3301 TaxID=3067904 RepID=UPI002740661F|nr:multicopper oxidase domain-containing protein [Pararhizobium sp. IMCC3301]